VAWLRSDWGAGSLLGPGEVRLALLSLLADEPMHGYELMKRLEERSAGLSGERGTIYRRCNNSRTKAKSSSESLSGKRVYKLTEAGRGELKERDETSTDLARRGGGRLARRLDPDSARFGPGGTNWSRLHSVRRGRAGDERIERVREILLRALRTSRNSRKGSSH